MNCNNFRHLPQAPKWGLSYIHIAGGSGMKREIAEQAETILTTIRTHESADQGIRNLYQSAKNGDMMALDKLGRWCLELNNKVLQQLETNLSAL